MTKIKVKRPDVDNAALQKRLAAMQPGTYALAHEVQNLACDKRRKHGRGLDAAGESFAAGTRWVLDVREGRSLIKEQVYTFSGAGVFLTFSVVTDVVAGFSASAAFMAVPEDGAWEVTALALLDAMRPVERSFQSVREKAEWGHHGWQGLWTKVLRRLHEAGKISLDDIEAAVEAIDNEESES